LGTQNFQFNRLLKKIDLLIDRGVITDKVYVQAGYSDYKTDNFETKPFIKFEEMENKISECNLLITHGGTGTIVGGLKKGKNIIGVPRLQKYGEHVDDHQKEIIGLFSQKGLIIGINEIEELENAIKRSASFKPAQFISGNEKIKNIIRDFIEKT
jgi:UDP-N-acetylglucosamine transferase subunit ALG13